KRVLKDGSMDDLANFQKDFLGPEDMRTLDEPRKNASGHLVGGTHFERQGQIGVKGTRCYSATLTHRHQQAMVGPAAGGKIVEKDQLTENCKLRRPHFSHSPKVHARIATNVLNLVASSDFVTAIEKNSILNNIVGVGNPCNYAFPAMQMNIAPAVSDEACAEQGLTGMGFFGSPDGHRDTHDSPGGMTVMVCNSDIPEDYECGRFHLLALGVYIKLRPGTVTGFCGLNKHGGTPPIAPVGQVVMPHAYRLMGVCYPPSIMMSGAGAHVIPLASLPNNKLLKLGPEITTPM
ncbi:hypothetical protein BDN72DRAFT_780589, partial [Pluteus cervinus]